MLACIRVPVPSWDLSLKVAFPFLRYWKRGQDLIIPTEVPLAPNLSTVPPATVLSAGLRVRISGLRGNGHLLSPDSPTDARGRLGSSFLVLRGG